MATTVPVRRLRLAATVAAALLVAGCAETAEVFGSELYLEACATCHDREGYGLGPGTNAASLADGDIENAIRFGRTGMPAFGSSYSDEQVASLVTYLRRLQAGD